MEVRIVDPAPAVDAPPAGGEPALQVTAADAWPAEIHAINDAQYCTQPLGDMEFVEGALPKVAQSRVPRAWRSMRPYATLDGPGEVYVQVSSTPAWGERYESMSLAVKAPAGKPVAGRLFLAKPDYSGMVALRFRIDEAMLGADDEQAFLRAKRAHYRALLDSDIPGAAWYRQQVNRVITKLSGAAEPAEREEQNPGRRRGPPIERSFALLSGGQAISENLQLDRLLPATAAAEELVPLDSIEGITIREMNWAPLIQDIDPAVDPLADSIPADQYALFFSSFDALVDAVDHARTAGTPVLRFAEPRGEDARTQAWYEAQLGLPMGVLSRRLGPEVVQSIALTGADPYLRTGADLALLFEPKDTAALMALLEAQAALVASKNPAAEPVEYAIGEIEVRGFSSPDRSTSTYRATLGSAIAVSNSRAQLKRLAEVYAGQRKALADLPEYKFFRGRYDRTDPRETGLLVISDATIRRWCSPRWRIGASRRVRAAAVMADIQARHLDQLVARRYAGQRLTVGDDRRVAGSLVVTSRGAESETYGNLDFLTPILELDFDQATKAEAEAYAAWKDGYERNWRRFF